MTTASSGVREEAQQANPQILAWSILLLSFALFCLLFASLLVTAENFLFQSSLPMEVILNVGRGTVSVSDLANPAEQVGINGSAIPDGVIVRTDPQSQGTISFIDGDEGEERLLATLTLQRDSRVTLLGAQSPRFPWSRRGHEIALQDVIGEMNLTISDFAGQDMRVYGRTPGRAWLQMSGPGTYTIEGASEELRLFNHDGQVRLESADGLQSRVVLPGAQGAVLYESPRVEIRPGYVNLLKDEDFAQLQPGTSTSESAAWACDHGPSDSPPGAHEILNAFGLESLRFLRDGGVTTHGENFCVQQFGQRGLDLKEFDLDYLSIRASFFVEHASLGSCGTHGSECPLMLRMDYLSQEYLESQQGRQPGETGVRAVPPGGDAIQWRHGFFTHTREEWPMRCDTCIQDHELIHEKSWYVYESPNLLTLFSPDPPPEIIVGVWVYASGHEYDVRVRDVALLAKQRS
ncbi:MAG: hypothetical protein OXG07_05795 [Anaerolineaceae bacterium]|nr:hypothetical protein [Anaerolineaceae bacterium]